MSQQAGVRDLEDFSRSLEIRRASINDLSRICEIAQCSFPTPWTKQAFATEIGNLLWSRVVVAFGYDVLVGYMVFWSIGTELQLLNLAVDPQWRRAKVANELMNYLVRYGKKNGSTQIFLEVRESNHAAQLLYQKTGFEEIDIRRKYYTDTGEDARVMLLQLR